MSDEDTQARPFIMVNQLSQKDMKDIDYSERKECLSNAKKCFFASDILKRKTALLDTFLVDNLYDRAHDTQFSDNMDKSHKLLNHAIICIERAIDIQSSNVVAECRNYDDDAEKVEILVNHNVEECRTLICNSSPEEMDIAEDKASRYLQEKYVMEQLSMTQKALVYRVEDRVDRRANFNKKEKSVMKMIHEDISSSKKRKTST